MWPGGRAFGALIIVIYPTKCGIRPFWWAVPTLRKPQCRRGAKHLGTASAKVMPAENKSRPAPARIMGENCALVIPSTRPSQRARGMQEIAICDHGQYSGGYAAAGALLRRSGFVRFVFFRGPCAQRRPVFRGRGVHESGAGLTAPVRKEGSPLLSGQPGNGSFPW